MTVDAICMYSYMKAANGTGNGTGLANTGMGATTNQVIELGPNNR